jgi:hypothetical protein
MKQLPIIITMEGGLITGVSSADKQLIGHPVIVIDYDTEGIALKELDRISWSKTQCGSAGSADAYVRGDSVVQTGLTETTQRKLRKYHDADNKALSRKTNDHRAIG